MCTCKRLAGILLAITTFPAVLSAQCQEASETQARLLQATAASFQVDTLGAETESLKLAQSARLVGSVVATGDIRVWVFSGDEVIFDSEQGKFICVDISLQPGAYTLVYDNSLSVFAGKTVWSSLRIESEPKMPQRDRATTGPTASSVTARWRSTAQSIVNTLNPAYRNLVQQLGITQSPKAPEAIIEARLYGFAERNVDLYEQIVAASIAHSMAHALHAAKTNSAFESQRASLWREITGVSSTDAEPEIDRLTLALLCRSGFGDAGLVALLNSVSAGVPSRVNALRQMPACAAL
jgi:hypothetical protein